MSISEQVKELRELSDGIDEDEIGRYYGLCLETALDNAADTIESLSAKLADMERSAEDCGGWIPCKDRVPTNEECKVEHEFNVTVNANGFKTLTMDFEYETVRGKEVCRWKWLGRLSPWKVIAWRKKPEPYHEP